MEKLEKFLAGVIVGGLICMILFALTSCNRYVSVQDAANGKARCGQHLR